MKKYFPKILLPLVVILSARAVGVILMTTLLIVPAATARNLAKNSRAMFYQAPGTALISAVSGLIISVQEWAGTASGATIVLCSIGSV